MPNSIAAKRVSMPAPVLSGVETAHLLLGLSSFGAALYVVVRVVDGVVIAPWDAWVKFGVAVLVAFGLIGLTFLLLSRSSRLAVERRLVAAIGELVIDPRFAAMDQDSAWAMVAGRWVLDRFHKGAVVISVPDKLADPEKIRDALGLGGSPIEVLRLQDLDSHARETEAKPPALPVPQVNADLLRMDDLIKGWISDWKRFADKNWDSHLQDKFLKVSRSLINDLSNFEKVDSEREKVVERLNALYKTARKQPRLKLFQERRRHKMSKRETQVRIGLQRIKEKIENPYFVKRMREKLVPSDYHLHVNKDLLEFMSTALNAATRASTLGRAR